MNVRDEIDKLMAERPIPVESVLTSIQKAALVRDPEDLATIEILANMSDLMDEIIAVPALAALPAWGPAGLQVLRRILEDGFHGDGAQRILLTIAANGELPTVRLIPLPDNWWECCRITIERSMIEEATGIIRELMLTQVTDVRLRERLIH